MVVILNKHCSFSLTHKKDMPSIKDCSKGLETPYLWNNLKKIRHHLDFYNFFIDQLYCCGQRLLHGHFALHHSLCIHLFQRPLIQSSTIYFSANKSWCIEFDFAYNLSTNISFRISTVVYNNHIVWMTFSLLASLGCSMFK